jgi:hypothetical protein
VRIGAHTFNFWGHYGKFGCLARCAIAPIENQSWRGCRATSSSAAMRAGSISGYPFKKLTNQNEGFLAGEKSYRNAKLIL